MSSAGRTRHHKLRASAASKVDTKDDRSQLLRRLKTSACFGSADTRHTSPTCLRDLRAGGLGVPRCRRRAAEEAAHRYTTHDRSLHGELGDNTDAWFELSRQNRA